MDKLLKVLSYLAELTKLVPGPGLRRRLEEQVELAGQLASGQRPATDLERSDWIQTAFEAGVSLSDIAHQLGIGNRHVYRLRKMALLSPNERYWIETSSDRDFSGLAALSRLEFSSN